KSLQGNAPTPRRQPARKTCGPETPRRQPQEPGTVASEGRAQAGHPPGRRPTPRPARVPREVQRVHRETLEPEEGEGSVIRSVLLLFPPPLRGRERHHHASTLSHPLWSQAN